MAYGFVHIVKVLNGVRFLEAFLVPHGQSPDLAETVSSRSRGDRHCARSVHGGGGGGGAIVEGLLDHGGFCHAETHSFNNIILASLFKVEMGFWGFAFGVADF